MSKLTDILAVWDEDPDSIDDLAALCRWYKDGLRKSEQGLATAHVVRLFAARGGKTSRSRDWTTGIYDNGSDLSICFGESVKKYAVLRFLRWQRFSMNTSSDSKKETNKNR